MAATVDSKAAFAARLSALELTVLAPKFAENGWETFGDFGFASTSPPGGDPAIFQTEVLDKLLTPETANKAAKVRRLFAQAYAIAVQEMQSIVSSEPDNPVTMNPSEREARRKVLTERISGFEVTGASDPSFRLIDRCATILARGEVKYISWDKCTERGQELVDVPDVRALRIDRDGFVTSTAKDHDPDADLSSDLLLDLREERH